MHLITIHVGANSLYGYFAAAPVFDVAASEIVSRRPSSFGNLTLTQLFLPRYESCQDGADHMADFFMQYYFDHPDVFDTRSSYVVLATPGELEAIRSLRIRAYRRQHTLLSISS